VRRGLDDAELTLLHELAHFLDFTAIGDDDFFTGSFDRLRPDLQDALAEWGTVVAGSAAYRYLASVAHRGAYDIPLGHGLSFTHQLGPDEVRLVAYMLEPEELFARSYVQYIVTRSNDARLAVSFEAARDSPGAEVYPRFWDELDFIPITAALDGVFRMLGWLP
jgi:hypothetical protein